jgi:hypothetical protein
MHFTDPVNAKFEMHSPGPEQFPSENLQYFGWSEAGIIELESKQSLFE